MSTPLPPIHRPEFISAEIPRENNFDLLRFCLAVSVIYSHSYPLSLGADEFSEPIRAFSGGRSTVGSLSVDCFFIISGFLITQSWLRSKSIVDYLRRRVLRIFPGYIAVLAVCHFVVAPLAGVEWTRVCSSERLLYLVGRMLTLRYYDEPLAFPMNPVPYAINGSLWTIRFEFACYLLVPLLGVFGCFRRPRMLFGALAALLTIRLILAALDSQSEAFAADLRWEKVRELSQFVPCFVAGAAYLLYFDRIPRSLLGAAVALLALAAAMQSDYAYPLLAPLCLSYVVFWCAFNPQVSFPHFARYGDFSYGIYLYAFPIQQLAMLYCDEQLNPLMLFAVALPLSVVAGAASWYVVEGPFMRRKQRIESVAADGSSLVIAGQAVPSAKTHS